MDKRTIGIIATVVTVLCCGCPGLTFCLSGVMTLLGFGTYNISVPGSSSSGQTPPVYGLLFLCLAVILVAIPVIVGVVTLRRAKENAATVGSVDFNEPLPPSSG
ncbi:MAG: hypothetical protein ACOYYS_23610 [Chloroflexota bacterium]